MPSTKKLLQAAAGSAGGDNLYVEDVFSTEVYAGQSTDLTITNGIDFAGEGGLFWAKDRGTAQSHLLLDTERGTSQTLSSDSTGANSPILSSKTVTYNSDGITLPGSSAANPSGILNFNGYNNVGWSFRKAEKFFDVVTYTGNGTAGRTVAHNLGVAPGMIIIKQTTGTRRWYVWHESFALDDYIFLNQTSAKNVYGAFAYLTAAPTSTTITLASDATVNEASNTFVAYLFASDAGGYGDDGDENIIKCGSYVGDGGAGTTEVNLGFEPQWILVKASSAADNWFVIDNMRGWATESNTSNDAYLMPNNNNAESTGGFLDITSTGFKTTLYSNVNVSGRTYIYIAIRRPMKTPESGTEVFATAFDAGATNPTYVSGFVADMGIQTNTTGYNKRVSSRLTSGRYLEADNTGAEQTSTSNYTWDFMNGWNNQTINSTWFSWMFKRATGFMDVVCYSGSGSATTQAHNLGVAPEMMIVKRRDSTGNWLVYGATPNPEQKYLAINLTDAAATASWSWNNTSPTATNFTLGTGSAVNGSGGTFVNYLFATLAGVSKVGSYTGTGADLNVDCGFTAGARFILIKRTDSTGDWYVWDSVRGITAGNDPYLLLNTTAAEVTNTDYVDPLSSGFTVTSSAPAALNASGGSYIFLAIA